MTSKAKGTSVRQKITDLDALLVKADIKSTLVLTRKNAEADLDDGV